MPLPLHHATVSMVDDLAAAVRKDAHQPRHPHRAGLMWLAPRRIPRSYAAPGSLADPERCPAIVVADIHRVATR